MVVYLNGKIVIFMLKFLYGDNGSGMYIYVSVWKNNENFFSGEIYKGLSEFVLYFLGGVLRYVRGLVVFINVFINFYKCLILGYEVLFILIYLVNNRSVSVCIFYGIFKNSVRFEFRFLDSLLNFYLVFVVILMVGMDGVKNKIDFGEVMDINFFKLILDEIREKGIK